jgi:tRNA A22 N-methylase
LINEIASENIKEETDDSEIKESQMNILQAVQKLEKIDKAIILSTGGFHIRK